MRIYVAKNIASAGIAALFSATLVLGTSSFAQETDEPAAETQTIGQYARHYRSYRRDIDMMRDMTYLSAREVENTYELFMEYEPSDLTRGWFAHHAIVASRAPGFMDTVRNEANRAGRRAFLASAHGQPGYIWNLSSTTSAINYVFDGLYQDTVEAQAVGRVLKARAYSYMEGRYGSRLPADAVENASALLATQIVVPSVAGRSYVVPYRAQNVMSRVLELAARLSLEGSNGSSMNASGILIDDPDTHQCLRWARLNLAQCIAASRTTGEEAYCTGRHGVDDVSECWGWMVETSFDEAEEASLTQ